MKKLGLGILFGLIVLNNSSCTKDSCLSGNNYRIDSRRQVEAFDKISVNLSAVVQIIQDTGDSYVQFVVESNLEPYISTQVTDSVLVLSLNQCFDGHQDILIIIHYNTLNTIYINGPGDVSSLSLMEQDSLNLVLESSGNIDLTTNIGLIRSTISGTGSLQLNGEIGVHYVSIGNSGQVNTLQAMTQRAIIELNGTGNMYLQVRDSILGNMSGSGDLLYKGNPIINVNNTGTGKIIRL